MRTEYSFKQILFVEGLIVAISLLLAIVVRGQMIKIVAKPTNIVTAEQSVLSLPVQLKIPSIKIDAPILSVGVTPSGAMDTPKGPKEAAWYNLGPRPGEVGSAVIDGHYGWKDNIPAVFDDLNKIQKGDKIYVTDNKGAVNTFIVNEIRNYGENEKTSKIFSSSDGLSHLNLITCEGIWNAKTKSYSGRLVVFADKEL
jgi:sortase A